MKLLTSSCSDQNHAKNPRRLPQWCKCACHPVRRIISSWRKYTLSLVPTGALFRSVHSHQRIKCSDSSHLFSCHCHTTSSSVLLYKLKCLSSFQPLFLILTPALCPPTLSLFPPPTPPPLVLRAHCELWCCRCLKGLFSTLSERLGDFYFVSRQQL